MKSESNGFFILLLLVLSFLSGYLLSRVQILEGKKVAAAVAAPTAAIVTTAPAAAQPTPDLSVAPAVTDKDHILGDKSAEVLLVEYADFECPFCKQFHPTMQQVIKEYGNKVAWVYRHYPLPFHANAQKEAEASECAAELGGNNQFWAYTDKIYERTTSNGTGFALADLAPLAKEIGLDETQFKTCLDSGKYAQKVKDDEAGGQKAGIQGTPGTIILAKNGKRDLIGGALPFDQVKQQIDNLIK